MTLDPASILGDKNSTKIERTCAQKLAKVDKDELMAKCKGLNREMKEKGEGNISRCIHQGKAGRKLGGVKTVNRVMSLFMVQQCQAAIVAAQSAVETIVEYPLLAVLKFNTDEAQATRNLGLPLFNYPAQAPRGEPAVENLISHAEIGLAILHIHRP